MGIIGTATITNPEVNNGNTINLQAKSINTKIEVYSNTQDKANNYNDTYNNRLSYGVNTGFKNPAITLTGSFRLGETHATETLAPIDYEYIEELIKRSDQVMTLTCDFFKTTTNTTGTKNVMIKNVSMNNNNNNIIEYNMTLVEVRSDT